MDPIFICLNRKGLEEVLPHRGRALRKIDGVVYDPGVPGAMKGVKAISADDHDLDGHFPGAPTYPGYAQDEFICLVAAALLSVEGKGLKANPHVVQKVVRYKQRAVPGDTLIADVRIAAKKSKFVVFAGEIRNQNEEVVAEYEKIVGAV